MTVFFDKALTKNISPSWFVSKKIKNNPVYLMGQYLEVEKQEYIVKQELLELNEQHPQHIILITPVIFFLFSIFTRFQSIVFPIFATISVGSFMIISEFSLLNLFSPTVRKIRKKLKEFALEKDYLKEKIIAYFFEEKNKHFAYEFLQQGLAYLEEKEKHYGEAFSRYLKDNYCYHELKTDFLTALNEQNETDLWFEIKNIIDLESDLADIYEEFLDNQKDIIDILKIEEDFDNYCIKHNELHFEKEVESIN